MQKALDIQYAKTDGSLNLGQLSQLLEQGWKVVSTETSGGGDIMVIVEKDEVPTMTP